MLRGTRSCSASFARIMKSLSDQAGATMFQGHARRAIPHSASGSLNAYDPYYQGTAEALLEIIALGFGEAGASPISFRARAANTGAMAFAKLRQSATAAEHTLFASEQGSRDSAIAPLAPYVQSFTCSDVGENPRSSEVDSAWLSTVGNQRGGNHSAEHPSHQKARGSREIKANVSKRKRKSGAVDDHTRSDWLFGAPQPRGSPGKKIRDADGTSTDHRASKLASEGGMGSGMLVQYRGRTPRLDMVSFKKLSKGVVVLGVVFKVNDQDMIVSLPSSLTGVVRRKEVSDQFFLGAALDGRRNKRGTTNRRRYYEGETVYSTPLTDLFYEGQVVRCAIVSITEEGKGRRIELSLRASVVNKGLSLSQLTKGFGVCGSISSVEDHGYVVMLGVEGVTAFLPTKLAPSKGLKIGQPVETVIETIKGAARTVTLSAAPSLVSSTVVKGTSFDLRSLKPGMLVDAHVNSVLPNGLLVNFLGYFTGCVDHNNMPTVSGDGVDEKGGWRSRFKPGPNPVRARILLVDYVKKVIRLTLRPHLVEMRAPSSLPSPGELCDGEIVRVDPALGLLLRVGAQSSTKILIPEGPEKAVNEHAGVVPQGGVGAYVHISRISDERVEHVEKNFKAGQKVRCRITGSSLVEGWAAASLRASVLSAAVLTYRDLHVGALVEGDVAAVESFGVLVKLGEGVRALVSKTHLADTPVKNHRARFKVGARVTGRVLTVDADSCKATLTLKRSMVKDKLPAVTSYEKAQEGQRCTGFVTKVAPFGLHVTFYGNVYGLLPIKALTKHGIDNPSEDFTTGQVVSCVIHECNSTRCPPKLSLGLDVAGSAESVEMATTEKEPEDGEASTCPFAVGDVVAGVVLGENSSTEALVVGLNYTSPGEKKTLLVHAVLPRVHTVDLASTFAEKSCGKLEPGAHIDRLLVLDVDEDQRPTVSMKPLLLAATFAEKSLGDQMVIPRAASDVSVGDIVAGAVSRLESFGVFVKFMSNFTALCPRSMAADRPSEDLHDLFHEGDSIRCLVQRVDEETGRVVVTCKRAAVPPSPALFLRSLLVEMFAFHAQPLKEGINEIGYGTTTNAEVIAFKEYGIVLKAKRSKSKGEDEDGAHQMLMLCPIQDAMEGLHKGDEVKVRVLGTDAAKGVIYVTMDTHLVKAGRSKRQKALVPHENGDTVSGRVVLAKVEDKWAVIASDDGRLYVVQVADFHCPNRTCREAGLVHDGTNGCSSKPVRLHARVACTLTQENLTRTGREPLGQYPNPYLGAVLTVINDGGSGSARKSRRKSRGESLDIGDEADETIAEASSDLMREGKISLGKIVQGAEVVCEVTSVHSDRLDVKVAVRYPRSWGPRDEHKGTSHKIDDATGAEAIKDNEPQSVRPDVEVESPKRSKKRGRKEEARNVDAKKTALDGEEGQLGLQGHRSAHSKKRIARIRAKVHVTSAGRPGVDAPFSREGQSVDGADEDSLPDWHPLRKYRVGQVLRTRVLHITDIAHKEGSPLHFRLLELGILENSGVDRPSDVERDREDAEATKKDIVWWGERVPHEGQVHRGVVSEVVKDGVMVSLSSSVRGFVPRKLVGDNSASGRSLQEAFKTGMGCRVIVRHVDKDRERLILSLTGVPSTQTLLDSRLPSLWASADDADKSKGSTSTSSATSPGEVVQGSVDRRAKEWAPPCLMVRLDGGGMGRVCVTEVADEAAWQTSPLVRFKHGDRVKCRVLPPLATHPQSEESSRPKTSASDAHSETHAAKDTPRDSAHGPVALSLRESRLDPTVDVDEAMRQDPPPGVGAIAKCFVVATKKSGCFVRLAGGVSGRVLLKLLHDTYIPDPVQQFPPGKLVAGKVLDKDETTGHVALTLQPSAVLDGHRKELTWKDARLKEGLKVKGTVSSVKDYGVFIQLQGSKVRGMCHRSEAADHAVADLTKVYEQGDMVKAIVIKVDRSKRRLGLSLKPQHFADDPDTSDDEGSDGEEGRAGPHAGDDGIPDAASGSDEPEPGSSKTREDDQSNFRREAKTVAPVDASDSEADSMSDDSDGDDEAQSPESAHLNGQESDESGEEENEQRELRSAKRPRVALAGGLSEAGTGANGANVFSLNFGELGSFAGAAASSDDQDSSDEDGEDRNAGGRGHRSRLRARRRREEEARIAARERALQNDGAAPETASDFERLLMANPNDSLLWAKFMAFKLSLADVEGARSVAERALKSMSFREESERYNIWVALMNLEHKFGSRATLKAVSERARQNSNPKKIYLHLAEIHEKASEVDECEEVFQMAVKKFRHSQKVWVAFQLSRLKRGDDAGAREILQRSLQSLARHKHVAVISRFAQNEFEYGSVERGRLVFEGLLASYPKRLDLWNVCVDKEIKAGNIRAARHLLERLTCMDFNAKRMKGVFKKYLQFEVDHGDEAGVELVKAKAKDYVASLVD